MKLRFLCIISFVINVAMIIVCVAFIVKQSLVKTPNDIFNDLIDSVVEIKASQDGIGESYGSGIVYSDDGKIITNAHVLTYRENGDNKIFDNIKIRFYNTDEYESVELVKIDVEMDLALIKYDTSHKLSYIPFSNVEYTFGDIVYAIGNTSNYGLGISHGIISVPEVNIFFDGIQHVMIQADINIASGNSGGALVDNKGFLIGITTFRTKDFSGNINYGFVYSIPMKIIQKFANGE